MKIQSTNISYHAGLTKNMQNEIAYCDINKISNAIAKRGIVNNFKDNKLLAWCSIKIINLIDDLNSTYKLNLGMPNGIFVYGFAKLNINNKEISGFVNVAPTKLYSEKSIVVPEKTIFYNEYKDYNYKNGNIRWDKIDEISDLNYKNNLSPTNYFLDEILHEFLHVIHEDNMLNKLGGKKCIKRIQKCLMPENLNVFREKYSDLLSPICTYATNNPLDAIACDLTRRLVDNIEKNTLEIKKDFIKNSPYNNKFFIKDLFKRKEQLDIVLKNFWNGKF